MWALRPSARPRDGDRLYVFITSWKPDPYVNALVYALQHFQLTQVYFVSISEHAYESEDESDDKKSLSAIRAGIEARLRELSDGRYTRDDGQLVSIGQDGARLYAECCSSFEMLENTSVVIRWTELDTKLASYSSGGSGIFDVTALKKNLLVDTVSLLVSRGCSRVYDFEITRKGPQTFDERYLIHNLEAGNNLLAGDYVYRNLAESPHVKRAEHRMIARSLKLRSLLIVTAAVGVVVLAVQIFFPKSWLETAVLALASVAAIAGWLSSFRRD